MEAKIRDRHKDIIEGLHRGIKQNFLTSGHLIPAVFLLDHEGKVSILLCPILSSDGDKENLARAVRSLAFRLKAIGIIMALEAWKCGLEGYKISGKVSEAPDKQEVIMIQEEYLDGEYATVHKIVRDVDEVSLIEGKLQTGATDKKSRFYNLLSKPTDEDFDRLMKKARG